MPRIDPTARVDKKAELADDVVVGPYAVIGPEATIDALMSVTGYFRISRSRALDILAEVEKAVAQWRKHGRALYHIAFKMNGHAPA